MRKRQLINFLLLVLLISGCTNFGEVDSLYRNTKASDLNQEFGEMHNVILSKFMTHCSEQMKKDASTISENQFREYLIESSVKDAIDFFEVNSDAIELINEVDYLTSFSIEQIQANMSTSELALIERMRVDAENDLKLTNEVFKEYYELSKGAEIRTEAMCAFISIYQYSIEFWTNNAEEWREIVTSYIDGYDGDKRMKGIKWGNVFFADAYYGWWGLVSTGQAIVGLATGIVGSGLTALN